MIPVLVETAPWHATVFTLAEEASTRLTIEGHVADFHTVVVVRHHPRGDQRGEGTAGEELKRPTAADRALGQSAGQIVEGAIGSLLAHLCPLFPEGRDATGGLAPLSVDQRR
jgi:hypothetical protein